jgi:hypothetical protein
MRRGLISTLAAAAFLLMAEAASAQQVDYPRNPAPAWFTEDFRQQVDASGRQGVPLDEPGILDVCPGVVFHEGGVGTGTCLVFPFGCTANFVYYNGNGPTAPAVANGSLYLGTAGHCVEKVGDPVYGAVSTPGVGATIQRIGTVSKFRGSTTTTVESRTSPRSKSTTASPSIPAAPSGGRRGSTTAVMSASP